MICREIGDFTRILCNAFELTLEPNQQSSPLANGFELLNNRLNFGPDQDIAQMPILILQLFEQAQQSGHYIHPEAIRAIQNNVNAIDQTLQRNPEANRLFLKILMTPERILLILRRMNEAGFLERFIPDFRHAIALMQFDRYHVFTVDEHTLRAIDIGHKMKAGELKDRAPLASALIQDLGHQKILFVALLLHDICKGRGGQHEMLGAELALRLCPRLGLNDKETRLCSWLIFEHLFLSHCAFRRDIQDPKTIDDLLARIYDIERLQLLTVFTTIDIMAVGPDRYTAWKDTLLQELYYRAEAVFSGKKDFIEPYDSSNLPPIPAHLPDIQIRRDEDKNTSIVTVFASDQKGLFSLLAGTLSASRVSILEARITTLDNDHIAYDSFTIQGGGQTPLSDKRYTEIKTNIKAALESRFDIESALRKLENKESKRDHVFDVPTKIHINNKASQTDTVIEISTRDQKGLLYRLSKVFHEFDLSLHSAKINTYGLKAVDVFYVRDQQDQKITDKARLKNLKEALCAAL